MRDAEDAEFFLGKLKGVKRDQSVIDTLQILIQQKIEYNKPPQRGKVEEPREDVSLEESEEALNKGS